MKVVLCKLPLTLTFGCPVQLPLLVALPSFPIIQKIYVLLTFIVIT
jgi:hypothetical protein